VEPRAARRLRRIILWVVALALIGTGAMIAIGYARRHPEDLPWTQLDLTRPVGLFTGRKLAGLRDEPGRCRALLGAAGISHRSLPPLLGRGELLLCRCCGWSRAAPAASRCAPRRRP
jgi:hypothetical protein